MRVLWQEPFWPWWPFGIIGREGRVLRDGKLAGCSHGDEAWGLILLSTCIRHSFINVLGCLEFVLVENYLSFLEFPEI